MEIGGEGRGAERNSPAEALGTTQFPILVPPGPRVQVRRALALKAAWMGSLASPDMCAGFLGSISGGNCSPEMLTHYPVTAVRAMSS